VVSGALPTVVLARAAQPGRGRAGHWVQVLYFAWGAAIAGTALRLR
jgi:hypothetical protein